MPGDGAALLAAVSGGAGEVRTEIHDSTCAGAAASRCRCALFHRVAFGYDGAPGASRTLVLNRSAGEDVAEGQRAAEVRFARFFNNTPLAIATINRIGRIARTNGPFARLFGAIFKGMDASEPRSILAVVAERDREALRQALDRRRSRAGATSPPSRSALAGEGARSARFFVSSVENEGEDGEAAIVYALDTTEQRALEAQFAQAQKMQAVGELAGGVAHDFNNVLQGIMGYADLLLVNHRPTDPSFQDIMQIKQNASRAAGLVRQLLAFSRRQTLRPQVMHFGDVLSDSAMLLKRLLGERVELDVRHGRDLWPVRADLTQFEQVIVNLAVNARDAMPEGGKLTIRTRNMRAEESGRVELAGHARRRLRAGRDRGYRHRHSPGDHRQDLPALLHHQGGGKGTGLGLSMVYGFVKQSGGFIFCDSVGGQGHDLPHLPAAPRGERGRRRARCPSPGPSGRPGQAAGPPSARISRATERCCWWRTKRPCAPSGPAL